MRSYLRSNMFLYQHQSNNGSFKFLLPKNLKYIARKWFLIGEYFKTGMDLLPIARLLVPNIAQEFLISHTWICTIMHCEIGCFIFFYFFLNSCTWFALISIQLCNVAFYIYYSQKIWNHLKIFRYQLIEFILLTTLHLILIPLRPLDLI